MISRRFWPGQNPMGTNMRAGFREGGIYELKGDVTTLQSISNQSPAQLEKRIGYAAGRLGQGFFVFFLVSRIGPSDFIWGDQTRYSGRFQFRRDVDAYMQRQDVFRNELMKKHGSNEALADAEFYDFMGRQQSKLNAREGADRIVKIVPLIRHQEGMDSLEQYPNAPMGHIPQWTLVRPKKFSCAAHVLPGAIYAA